MWEIKQAANPDVLEVYIYGDVKGDGYDFYEGKIIESETSANHFREELAKHPDVKQIKMFINSYGGSVFEGTAIYSQLKRHPANKTAYVDGFACSIASVIAMAADKVIMPKNTSMMIHNAWMVAIGNAAELRKAAEDLDKINQSNRQAYLMKAGDKLTEEKLIELLDAETWLTAEECIEFGLADEYAEQDADLTGAAENLKQMNLNIDQQLKLHKSIAAQLRQMIEPEEEPETAQEDSKPEEPETPEEPEENKVLSLFKAIGRKEKKE
jgi:ATP-dependent Clp protease, protease subunit